MVNFQPLTSHENYLTPLVGLASASNVVKISPRGAAVILESLHTQVNCIATVALPSIFAEKSTLAKMDDFGVCEIEPKSDDEELFFENMVAHTKLYLIKDILLKLGGFQKFIKWLTYLEISYGTLWLVELFSKIWEEKNYPSLDQFLEKYTRGHTTINVEWLEVFTALRNKKIAYVKLMGILDALRATPIELHQFHFLCKTMDPEELLNEYKQSHARMITRKLPLEMEKKLCCSPIKILMENLLSKKGITLPSIAFLTLEDFLRLCLLNLFFEIQGVENVRGFIDWIINEKWLSPIPETMNSTFEKFHKLFQTEYNRMNWPKDRITLIFHNLTTLARLPGVYKIELGKLSIETSQSLLIKAEEKKSISREGEESDPLINLLVEKTDFLICSFQEQFHNLRKHWPKPHFHLNAFENNFDSQFYLIEKCLYTVNEILKKRKKQTQRAVLGPKAAVYIFEIRKALEKILKEGNRHLLWLLSNGGTFVSNTDTLHSAEEMNGEMLFAVSKIYTYLDWEFCEQIQAFFDQISLTETNKLLNQSIQTVCIKEILTLISYRMKEKSKLTQEQFLILQKKIKNAEEKIACFVPAKLADLFLTSLREGFKKAYEFYKTNASLIIKEIFQQSSLNVSTFEAIEEYYRLYNCDILEVLIKSPAQLKDAMPLKDFLQCLHNLFLIGVESNMGNAYKPDFCDDWIKIHTDLFAKQLLQQKNGKETLAHFTQYALTLNADLSVIKDLIRQVQVVECNLIPLLRKCDDQNVLKTDLPFSPFDKDWMNDDVKTVCLPLTPPEEKILVWKKIPPLLLKAKEEISAPASPVNPLSFRSLLDRLPTQMHKVWMLNEIHPGALPESSSNSLLASHQYLQHFRLLIRFFEMLETSDSQVLIIGCLATGHLCIEQCFTSVFLNDHPNFPLNNLSHSLNRFSEYFGVSILRWIEANNFTNWMRWPHSDCDFSALNLAGRKLVQNYGKSLGKVEAEKFKKEARHWIHDALEIIISILSLSGVKSSKVELTALKKLSQQMLTVKSISEEFALIKPIQLAEGQSKQFLEILATLTDLKGKLDDYLLLDPKVGEKAMQSLEDVKTLISNVFDYIKILLDNPQERYFGNIAFMLLIAIQYSILNIGRYLAHMVGEGGDLEKLSERHNFRTYCQHWNLDQPLTELQKQFLNTLNLGKRSEYFFKHYQQHGQEPSPILELLMQLSLLEGDGLMRLSESSKGHKLNAQELLQKLIDKLIAPGVSTIDSLIKGHCR